MSDWKARVEWRPPFGHRIHLSRLQGDKIQYLESADLRFSTCDEGTYVESSGLAVDAAMLQPLYEALAEVVKPIPSEVAVAHLREALAVERARVDLILKAERVDQIISAAAGYVEVQGVDRDDAGYQRYLANILEQANRGVTRATD